ncbi:MAG: tenascin-X, partial [Myxococcaceae bacterium]
FFLVVLDAAGSMVAATQLTHPMLDQCNHPHPFGIAADVAGSLYLSFSPSLKGAAPLTPQAPTLLMSFSRDGVFRWQRTEQILGGELAVAQGRLYPENSGTAFNTLTGGVDWLLNPQPAGVFGRVVVLADRVIPSPRAGTAQLWEYSTAGNLSWTWSLPPGELFASDQLRLASWRFRADEPPQSVALTFVQRAAQPWLVATDTRFATETWACPLGGVLRTAPQMFEVAEGTVAVMEGSNQCGTCDPAFADSQAAFHTYSLPGIEPPFAPWTGTWGGPGHDHREDPLTGVAAPTR